MSETDKPRPYVSGESGLPQIYVVPFPSGEGKWQISPNGGIEPHWSQTKHELFYAKRGMLISVPYTTEKGSSTAGAPEDLRQAKIEMRAPYTSYDVAPDGEHFVAFQFPSGRPTVPSEPTVAIHWLDEVRNLVSSGQSNAQ